MQIELSAISVSQTESQIARRKHFKKDALLELGQSIKSEGLLNPIILRKFPGKADRFELIAGERRFLSAGLVGLTSIESSVRELTDEQVIKIQLVENLQREGLHPLEEAEGYEQLMKRFEYSADDLADEIGKSKAYVYARLKLLALCKDARAAFYEGRLTASVALLVARISVEVMQKEALKRVADKNFPMSTREAADYIQDSFMLRLDSAPFPTESAGLYPIAGPCSICPKNSLSQPSLFDDLKVGRAGVCTDPVCFRHKSELAVDLKFKEAKEKGQQVVEGPAAKKILPYGEHRTEKGFHKLDEEIRVGDNYVKVKSIIGPDAKTTLVKIKDQDNRPKLVEVIDDATVRAGIKAKGLKKKSPDGYASQEKTRYQIEGEVRKRLYLLVRAKSPAKASLEFLRKIAAGFYRRVWSDAQGKIFELWDLTMTPAQEKRRKANPWFKGEIVDSIIAARVAKMNEKELCLFLSDCTYAPELCSPNSTPRDLLASAKKLRIDLNRIRSQIRAERAAKKKKPKAKAPAKKKARAKK